MIDMRDPFSKRVIARGSEDGTNSGSTHSLYIRPFALDGCLQGGPASSEARVSGGRRVQRGNQPADADGFYLHASGL